MNGAAIIMLGLVAYGTLHIDTGKFMPWQWYVPVPVYTGGIAQTGDFLQAHDYYGHHHPRRLGAILVRSSPY